VTIIFVNQSKRGAGHFIRVSGVESLGDSLHQGGGLCGCGMAKVCARQGGLFRGEADEGYQESACFSLQGFSIGVFSSPLDLPLRLNDRIGMSSERGIITFVIFCHMLVFDSSTLILTAKIELLDLFLSEIGMEVTIPRTVEEECCGGKKTFDAFMIQKAVDESRIVVRGVRNRKLVLKLKADFSMGQGESEAIALALQEKARLVGVDDKCGINACKLTGVPFITAVAILLRSRQKGLIDKDDALSRLSSLAKHGRYKSSILEDAKRRLEEQL